MEYEKYDSDALVISGPNMGQVVRLDRSGEQTPHATEMTFPIGATQTIQTALGDRDVHRDHYRVHATWFQDSTVISEEGAAVRASQREEKRWNSVPDYDLVNAQATLRTNDGHWEFALWGKNLTDEEYYTSVGNFWNSFGTALRYVGDPRTYGASVRYNW